MEQEHPCKGCVDAVEDSAGVGGYLCDYLTHNGHSRLKICPPREKCTVKSTVPRDTAEVRPEKRYEKTERSCCWDQSIARWLYSQGMSDADIARRVGTVRQVIREWRVRNDLPANVGRGGKRLD